MSFFDLLDSQILPNMIYPVARVIEERDYYREELMTREEYRARAAREAREAREYREYRETRKWGRKKYEDIEFECERLM